VKHPVLQKEIDIKI